MNRNKGSRLTLCFELQYIDFAKHERVQYMNTTRLGEDKRFLILLTHFLKALISVTRDAI